MLDPFDLSLPPAQRLTSLLGGDRRVLVLGMGNTLLGDDGVGHRLAEAVEALGRERRRGLAVGIALENAYGLVKRLHPDVLIIADAVAMEGMPLGAWDLWPPEGLDSAIHSTHSVPLPLFVAMWRQDLPGLEVAFLGINLGQLHPGAPLSKAVEAARQALLAILALPMEPSSSHSAAAT